MSDRLYRTIRFLAAPLAYRCLGAENIARGAPAVFVANHLGSTGPIQALLTLPVRLYPWIRAEMLDVARAPHFLYDDFTRPTLHLEGRLGIALSHVISRAALLPLRGIDAVSIEHSSGIHFSAFRHSLELLLVGKSLLIFPENPDGPLDPVSGLRPFMGGFAQLGQMYARRTGTPLPVHPMAISAVRKALLIGPALHIGADPRHADTKAVCVQLQQQVDTLWRRLEGRGIGQVG